MDSNRVTSSLRYVQLCTDQTCGLCLVEDGELALLLGLLDGSLVDGNLLLVDPDKLVVGSEAAGGGITAAEGPDGSVVDVGEGPAGSLPRDAVALVVQAKDSR